MGVGEGTHFVLLVMFVVCDSGDSCGVVVER